MMARSNRSTTGRIHYRKTNLTMPNCLLQRTAGPYIWVKSGLCDRVRYVSAYPSYADIAVGDRQVA
jgi:hypothetical protein